MDIWPALIEQYQQQSVWELFAVGFAIAYVWLAAEESIWCWPAGFITTGLYAYVYWDVTLVFQMLLNIYYMAMAIWGFVSWQKTGENALLISRMSLKLHINVIALGVFISAVTYYIASYWLEYDLIILDIAVSVFSLLATYLTVIKKLENWFYWSLINLVSIHFLLATGLYLSIVLMLLYIAIAMKGFVQWLNTYNSRSLYDSSVQRAIER